MKEFAALSVFFVLVLGGCGVLPDQPDRIVENFLDALKYQDGERAVNYLSDALVSDLCEEGNFNEVRDNPEDGVALLASMGVGVSVEDFQSMTGTEFIAAVIGSPIAASEARQYENAVIGKPVISGSTATVTVTTGQETEIFELVQVDGQWKLNSLP